MNDGMRRQWILIWNLGWDNKLKVPYDEKFSSPVFFLFCFLMCLNAVRELK